MTALYQVTLSGSYRAANNEVIDFSDVKGIVPANAEDVMNMHIRRRHAPMLIAATKNKDGESAYPKRLESIRECYIDDMKPVAGEPSYAGLDVKELTAEQLQDLALGKDLRAIPLYRTASLRFTREKAYVAYAASIGHYVDDTAEGFNFMKLPPLVLDGEARKDTTKKLTNDEVLAGEEGVRTLDSDGVVVSAEDEKAEKNALMAAARHAGVKFSNNITLAALKTKMAEHANAK